MSQSKSLLKILQSVGLQNFKEGFIETYPIFRIQKLTDMPQARDLIAFGPSFVKRS